MGVNVTLDFISDCNLIENEELSAMANCMRKAFRTTGVKPDEQGTYARSTAARMLKADEMVKSAWAPETLDLMATIHIDAAPMPDEEPDVSDGEEDEATTEAAAAADPAAP